MVWDTALNVWQQAGQNAPLIIVLCLMATGAALSTSVINKDVPGWYTFPPRSYRKRGKKMRKDRLDHVINTATQDFVDSVENRVYHGEFTRAEASEIYRRMKRIFPIRNLFPNPELLKEKLKARQGTFIEPNLPGKKLVVKRKHLFDRAERVIL